MRRFLKIVGILAIAAVAVPGLLFAFGVLLRYYALHLAPVRMHVLGPSPNDKYVASVGYRGFMGEYADRTLFLQEPGGRPKAVWKGIGNVQLPLWSPDSRFIAIGHVRPGRHIREFTEASPRRYVAYADYRFSIYDVQTGHRAEVHGDCDLGMPADCRHVPVGWEWRDRDSILLTVRYNGTEVRKPIALVTVKDTSSELAISSHSLVKLGGTQP